MDDNHGKQMASLQNPISFQFQSPWENFGSNRELTLLQTKYNELQSTLTKAIQKSESHRTDWQSCQTSHEETKRRLEEQMSQSGTLESALMQEQKAKSQLMAQMEAERQQMQSIEAQLITLTNDHAAMQAAMSQREQDLQAKLSQVQQKMEQCEQAKLANENTIAPRTDLVETLEEAKEQVQQMHRLHRNIQKTSGRNIKRFQQKSIEQQKLFGFMSAVQDCVRTSSDVKKCANDALKKFKK